MSNDQKLDYWKKFNNYKKIGSITGNNFLNFNIKINSSYYFSKYAHCWGWGTWRDRWVFFDKNISFWNKWQRSKKYNNLFNELLLISILRLYIFFFKFRSWGVILSGPYIFRKNFIFNFSFYFFMCLNPINTCFCPPRWNYYYTIIITN